MRTGTWWQPCLATILESVVSFEFPIHLMHCSNLYLDPARKPGVAERLVAQKYLGLHAASSCQGVRRTWHD